MQGRESGVFLAATSNNITILPPEMLRKGRFDEIFFVDLPGVASRTALFALHIRKRGRDAAGFGVAKLAAASGGGLGAGGEEGVSAGGVSVGWGEKRGALGGFVAGRAGACGGSSSRAEGA